MSTQHNHTPGPWRVGNAGMTIFGPPTSLPSPVTIANLAESDRVSADRRKANAHLIAAAPALLDALRRAVDDDLGDNWKIQALSAIAKATGERYAKAQGGAQ